MFSNVKCFELQETQNMNLIVFDVKLFDTGNSGAPISRALINKINFGMFAECFNCGVTYLEDVMDDCCVCLNLFCYKCITFKLRVLNPPIWCLKCYFTARNKIKSLRY